ncbi:MAG TPA: lactate permease LctP family transporter [Opitutus sp.]|nr:lactate permease LctP family transporter [Opitutus sp.]
MPWSQTYSPVGGLAGSALIAALPVVTLLGLLAIFRVRAHLAALAGLAVALGIAIFAFGMPAPLATAAATFGAAYGLFPIGWIILNAIFVYQLSVETGGFAVIQRQIAGLSGDHRIQALLIAFSFGAFLEGAAGFGTPVAITGALLIGLGFRPLEAAKLALIGNTAPVAFGALGTPLLTLAKITGLDLDQLSAMVGRQLPLFSLIVPFWLIIAHSGWRSLRAVWPACLVTGASFAASQFLVSNYIGPMLVDIISAAVSIVALVVLTKFWRPRDAPAAPPPDVSGIPLYRKPAAAPPVSTGRAWLPWICLSVFVFLWGLPVIKNALNAWFAPSFTMPHLHLLVQRMPPVVPKPTLEDATFSFNFLSATGTALLLAGIAGGLVLGLSPGKIATIYGRTLWRVRVSLLTIAVMLGLGFTTRYSGTDTTMGLALAATGAFYPFFAPLIGWLGVALTGSDTASNVLFGNLQKVTAQQLGLSPILMAASNSSGGVMGKMIDAQSIVVAAVVTGGHDDSPDAGTVLRAVFWHSVGLAVLVGVLVVLQTYLWPGIVPH